MNKLGASANTPINDTKEPNLDELKPVVSELLWRFLPGRTPLARADMLACRIVDLVLTEWSTESEDAKPDLDAFATLRGGPSR